MSGKKLISILFCVLILQLLVSVISIAPPAFLKKTGVFQTYRKYFLPGPFFQEQKITNSYSLLVSSKKSEWSLPVIPTASRVGALGYRLDPRALYRNRFERSLYQGFFWPEILPVEVIRSRPAFQFLTTHLLENDIPAAATSVRLIFTRKVAGEFQIRIDTLAVITYPK